MTRGLVQLLENIRKLISTKGYKVIFITDLSDSDMRRHQCFLLLGETLNLHPVAVSSSVLICAVVSKYPETFLNLSVLWTVMLLLRSPFSLTRFILTCSDQKKIYVGDDNPLTLIVKAQNQGEGAYEAELIVSIPLQADFIGVVRNSEVSKLPL